MYSRKDGATGTLVSGYDCVLLDLDGTLYTGEVPIDGATEALARLRAEGHGVVFMTNNSSRTDEAVAAHLAALGFSADPSEVVSSAAVTAELLRSRGVVEAFVIGGEGLRSAMDAVGIRRVGEDAERADCVVVGWDTEVTYAKLRAGAVLVQRGAALIATNPDKAFPSPDGLRWPGAGALLAVIVETTGATPEIVGKPFSPLYEAALEAGGGGKPLVVGDRLDTDIAGAAALGWDSALVLTGISSTQDLEGSSAVPTFVLADLGGLFEPA